MAGDERQAVFRKINTVQSLIVMYNIPSHIGVPVALVLGAIAVFLISATWVPGADSLMREQGVVVAVEKQANTWYEARIHTASGIDLTCRAQKNAVGWASRCPVAALESRRGTPVSISHNGSRIYIIESAGETLLGFDEHRKAQATSILLAAMLFGMMGLALWQRK